MDSGLRPGDTGRIHRGEQARQRRTVGGEGAGLTAYSSAYAVWILPHSLMTVSLATALLRLLPGSPPPATKRVWLRKP